MKTLVYELRLGRYELTDIDDSGGEDVRMLFELPLDGWLSAGGRSHAVKNGTLTLKLRELPNGRIAPKLYTGGSVYELDELVVGDGAILPFPRGEEYLKLVSAACEDNKRRIEALESELAALKKRTDAPLEF